MKAVKRVAHIFPGGLFWWRFKDDMPISITDYLLGLLKTVFPDKVGVIYPESVSTELPRETVRSLGQAIVKNFTASTLLILDHVDTLKRAEANGDENATALVAWLQDAPVKILATSQEPLG